MRWSLLGAPPVALILLLLLAVAGCGEAEPFSQVQVRGRVTYDDGSLIPAEQMSLTFVPLAPPLDAKTFPKPGNAQVDVATGEFDYVTSHPAGSGLVVGQHRVGVQTYDAERRPTELVPPEAQDPATSGIVVDTAQLPFEIRVPRPKK